MSNSQSGFFDKAYRLLEYCTPLPVDCGPLCLGACCKGEEDAGMLLFPGEEERFVGLKDFEIIDTDYIIEDGNVVKLLLCNAKCDRSTRPLGCRIFPLFGFVTPEGKIEVRVDPRALEICPLAFVGLEEGFSKEFILEVKKVFEILMKDKSCANFIEIMTEQLNFGG